MRYLTSQLSYFYNGIIPEKYRQKAVPFYVIFITAVSVTLVSLFGKDSLMIIPAMVIGYAALKYPMFPLYLFFATVTVTPYLIPGAHRIYSYSLVLLIIALWFCRKMLMGYRAFEYSRMLLGYIVLFYFVLICTALNNGLTVLEINSLVRYTIFFPLVLVVYDMYKPRLTLPIFLSISLPLIVSSYYIFLVYMSAGNFIEFLNLYRMKPAGLFSNANVFGVMMIFAAPFWIALAIWGKKKYLRIGSAAIALILTISLLLSNSRSAIVGILFTALFYFIISKKVRYLLITAVLLVVIFASSPVIRIITTVGFRYEQGTSRRVDVWNNSLDIIKRNAVFGIGSGNFPEVYKPNLKTAFDKGFIGSVAHAHNEFLHAVVEFGIMGLFFITALFYIPLKKGFLLLKKPLSDFDRAAVCGSMGIIFANLGNSIFHANAIQSAGGLFPPILYWTTMIVILKLYKKYEGTGNKLILHK
ncbi:MAG: O-antigen ligase family protein [Candidatus Zixiibacteriota bacterium]|nr:MAG: O-antigen ligase family protein [candidate division Zixibacteria bacterium]